MTTQQEVSLAVMEHTNNECEVKEDTKQVAEMRSEKSWTPTRGAKS